MVWFVNRGLNPAASKSSTDRERISAGRRISLRLKRMGAGSVRVLPSGYCLTLIMTGSLVTGCSKPSPLTCTTSGTVDVSAASSCSVNSSR